MLRLSRLVVFATLILLAAAGCSVFEGDDDSDPVVYTVITEGTLNAGDAIPVPEADRCHPDCDRSHR